MKTYLRFPPLAGANKQGYTKNDIEAFKGEELMDNLTRETAQNSLDAFASDKPVRIKYELIYINSDEYPVFSQYKDCIAGCRAYWGESADVKLKRFLDDAERLLETKKIPVLIAGDYNTNGLTGSRDINTITAWEALTGADGVSLKASETSGGSYGIGKNAPFACSTLSMVFYNTFATDNEKAFVGVARMATMYNEKHKATQGTGKYQKNDDESEIWLPIYSEDEDKLRDLFVRDEYGTDVIIAGFNQVENWMDNVAKSVLKNFFVAIAEKKLEVVIKENDVSIQIDATTLEAQIKKYSAEKDMIITAQLYSTFTSPADHIKLSIIEKDDAELYVKTDHNFNRTVACLRSNGMIISLKSKRLFQHYAAVFVVRGGNLNSLLRDTEPARHNRWDSKLITGTSSEEKEKRKRARKAIQEIEDQILATLKNQFEVQLADTIDSGVGEYLSDQEDGESESGTGDDILKVAIKIGKVKKTPKAIQPQKTQGTHDTGKPIDGDVHNDVVDPHIPPETPPVAVDPTKPGTQDGLAPNRGTRVLTVPRLNAKRAYPVDLANGEYKIIVNPTASSETFYLTCSVLGEDGKREKLAIESALKNGEQIPIANGIAGPFSVTENIAETLIIRFKEKEEMSLGVEFQEEVIK